MSSWISSLALALETVAGLLTVAKKIVDSVGEPEDPAHAQRLAQVRTLLDETHHAVAASAPDPDKEQRA
jgi:hypothetical protein